MPDISTNQGEVALDMSKARIKSVPNLVLPLSQLIGPDYTVKYYNPNLVDVAGTDGKVIGFAKIEKNAAGALVLCVNIEYATAERLNLDIAEFTVDMVPTLTARMSVSVKGTETAVKEPISIEFFGINKLVLR